MMAPRIGLLFSLLLIFAGFISVKMPVALPRDGKSVYHFEGEGSSSGTYQSQSGGLFSLALGFKRSEQRAKLSQLLDKFSRGLVKTLDPSASTNVEVSVARVYATTSEIILNVSVKDASQTELIRSKLIHAISKIPGISFAGETRIVQVQ